MDAKTAGCVADKMAQALPIRWKRETISGTIHGVAEIKIAIGYESDSFTRLISLLQRLTIVTSTSNSIHHREFRVRTGIYYFVRC